MLCNVWENNTFKNTDFRFRRKPIIGISGVIRNRFMLSDIETAEKDFCCFTQFTEIS